MRSTKTCAEVGRYYLCRSRDVCWKLLWSLPATSSDEHVVRVLCSLLKRKMSLSEEWGSTRTCLISPFYPREHTRGLRKINLLILFFYYLELDFRLTIVLQLPRRFNRCSLTHLLRSPNTCTYVRDLPHCSIAPVVILQRNCYQLNTKLQMNCSMP